MDLALFFGVSLGKSNFPLFFLPFSCILQRFCFCSSLLPSVFTSYKAYLQCGTDIFNMIVKVLSYHEYMYH